MKNIIFSLIILFFILILNLTFLTQDSTAQVTQQWVARYNGPGNGIDQAISIAVDASENIYVTGESLGSGTDIDYATIKYDASGSQQWVMRYNGAGDSVDMPVGIALDNSGNVYVTGYSVGVGSGNDYTTIKYNPSGVVQWVRIYAGSGYSNDQASAIKVDGSGNVYVTGNSSSNIVTIEYDTNGDVQWIRTFPNSYATSIALDNNGNTYITGKITLKYNSTGILQWSRSYIGPYFPMYSHSIDVDNSGNVCITGEIVVTPDKVDCVTIKYLPNGDSLWTRVFENTGWNHSARGHAVGSDNADNVYVSGISRDNGFLTIKYSSSGVVQWVHGILPGGASAILVDGEGNSYEAGGINGDILTTKYDAAGNLIWTTIYNGSGNGDDFAKSIALDSNGNICVTGYSPGNGTGSDFVTIKYSQLTGITPVSSDIPKSYSLSQNYPNPFNPTTKIRFDIPSVGQSHAFDTELVIYDAIGREVATLVNQAMNPGTYEVEWNATDFPSGVYFYKLTTNNFSATKKLVLIK